MPRRGAACIRPCVRVGGGILHTCIRELLRELPRSARDAGEVTYYMTYLSVARVMVRVGRASGSAHGRKWTKCGSLKKVHTDGELVASGEANEISHKEIKQVCEGYRFLRISPFVRSGASAGGRYGVQFKAALYSGNLACRARTCGCDKGGVVGR